MEERSEARRRWRMRQWLVVAVMCLSGCASMAVDTDVVVCDTKDAAIVDLGIKGCSVDGPEVEVPGLVKGVSEGAIPSADWLNAK